MKTILILRHAKSDWNTPGQADFDRPLNQRGLADAPLIGQLLARFGAVPEQILSSPARRARQTAALVAEACGYQDPIQWEETFYEADSADLIAALKRLPGRINSVLLIGHNPTLEETIVTLCVGSRLKWGGVRLPTAGLVCLEAEVKKWAALTPGDEVVMRWFLIPRLMQAIAGGPPSRGGF
jgi:phosphohistidine phosphatase